MTRVVFIFALTLMLVVSFVNAGGDDNHRGHSGHGEQHNKHGQNNQRGDNQGQSGWFLGFGINI